LKQEKTCSRFFLIVFGLLSIFASKMLCACAFRDRIFNKQGFGRAGSANSCYFRSLGPLSRAHQAISSSSAHQPFLEPVHRLAAAPWSSNASLLGRAVQSAQHNLRINLCPIKRRADYFRTSTAPYQTKVERKFILRDLQHSERCQI